MTLHDSTIYIGAPIGEDDCEGAGDEGDHPQPRLRVASPQQAEQGGEQQEAEEDVNVPVVLKSFQSNVNWLQCVLITY